MQSKMAVEVTADLIADMQAILAHSARDINSNYDLKIQFATVYKKWTGMKICCDEVIPQEYNMMETVVRHFLNNKIKMDRPKSNYALADGMIIYYPERHMQVGNINLTDEIAQSMLSDHPQWAKHFTTIPEDGSGKLNHKEVIVPEVSAEPAPAVQDKKKFAKKKNK